MISEVKNIDCIEGMKEFPDKFFDLAIVDPPYGIKEDGRKTASRDYKRFDSRNGKQIIAKVKKYKAAGWDDKQPNQNYFDELCRVSKKQIIWGENYLSFKQKDKSKGRIIWNKFTGENDFSDCEIAWASFLNSVRLFNYMWAGFRQGKSVCEGHINQGNKSLCEERIHPTHKPVALYKWILKNYAKPNDKILDTHLGSGSSRIAAYNMGFDFWGFELDKDYYEAQEKRFKEQTAQMKLFTA
jgi:site-specific DNA-methyltransferase (adenine-specific)